VSFAAHFLDWFNAIVSLEAFTGSTDYGEHQYGAAVQLQCAIEEKIRKVLTVQGEERISNTTLYIAGGPIDPRDKITMPVTFKGPSQPSILVVSNIHDTDGSFSHAEVFL
jgi:hypothetical protein